jgi:hypothetical protein
VETKLKKDFEPTYLLLKLAIQLCWAEEISCRKWKKVRGGRGRKREWKWIETLDSKEGTSLKFVCITYFSVPNPEREAQKMCAIFKEEWEKISQLLKLKEIKTAKKRIG